EQRQNAEDHADVHGNGDAGEHAEQPVGDHHEDDNKRGPEIGRELALLDRILAEPGTHHALLDHGELGGKRTGAQKNGEVVGGLHRKVSGDLAASAQDRFANDGRGDHLVIEHDRKGPPDILLGDLREFARPGGVEFEGDDRLAGALIEAGLCVGEFLAGDDHPLLEQIGLPVLRLRAIDDFRVRRRTSLQRLLDRHRRIDEAERQLGGLAENFEQLLGIAEARHLNQNAIVSLALDRRLDEPELIDALADDLDRLIDDLPGTFKQRGLGRSEPHHATADVLDVERGGSGAADEPAERLRQFPQFRQSLLQIVLANSYLDRIAADDGSTGETDTGLAQDAADVVLQRQEFLTANIVGVDL